MTFRNSIIGIGLDLVVDLQEINVVQRHLTP
jgi:hypothetical protein